MTAFYGKDLITFMKHRCADFVGSRNFSGLDEKKIQATHADAADAFSPLGPRLSAAEAPSVEAEFRVHTLRAELWAG